MNIIHLKQTIPAESLLNGDIEGIAYSGSPIKSFGPYKNLIVDVSTLTVAKAKTPVFRDHLASQVSGHGTVSISEDVRFKGRISKVTPYGQEITALSAEGFDWEMSMGVFEGEIHEFENETYNGHTLKHGYVLKHGIIREVSLVALGADKNTSAEIFSINTLESKGEIDMFMTAEKWAEFACGCGGTKETKPEELAETFKASKEEVDKLKADIDALKAQIAEKQAIIDQASEEKQLSARQEEVALKVKEKGLEFSKEVIEVATKSEESKNMFLSMIDGMKADKKISAEFTQKVDLSKDKPVDSKDPEAISLAANQLIKDGKAKDFMQALSILEGVK